MSSGMNYSRPQFRRAGKETEAANGSDIPAAALSSPRPPSPSKASLREAAAQAVAAFGAARIKRLAAVERPDPRKAGRPTNDRPVVQSKQSGPAPWD